MMQLLKDQAIKTALTGDWNSAISLNEELLEINPEDIDTMNRLAFAYAEFGDIKKAKQIYQKVLNIDSFNPIAQKNLKRLASVSDATQRPTNGSPAITLGAFLEETGKTKCLDLVNLAQPDIIARLRIGETASIAVKRLKIFVYNQDKQYIGMLPDYIGNRLITLMDGGNEYEVFIKSFTKNNVTIFIKETKRAPKFKNQPSFLSSEKTALTIHDAKGGKKAKKPISKAAHEDLDADES